jgi:hypothetical protein
VCTNAEGSYFSCHVTTMLGAVSFIMFVGPNNKGLLYINIMLLLFFPLTGIRLLVAPTTVFLFRCGLLQKVET